MYIRVIPLHSKAFTCRERERERECVCVCVCSEGGGVAAIVLDLVLLGAALFASVRGLQQLARADLGVVLCKFDKGFKSLWIAY
jgi:hypothetical protein